MAYDFYIGDMLLPVPPEKLTIKIKGGNKTYTMMNEGQINVLKSAELTEISFDMFLPNHQYPFAVYKPDTELMKSQLLIFIAKQEETAATRFISSLREQLSGFSLCSKTEGFFMPKIKKGRFNSL